jgi:hypothetical protein
MPRELKTHIKDTESSKNNVPICNACNLEGKHDDAGTSNVIVNSNSLYAPHNERHL